MTSSAYFMIFLASSAASRASSHCLLSRWRCRPFFSCFPPDSSATSTPYLVVRRPGCADHNVFFRLGSDRSMHGCPALALHVGQPTYLDQSLNPSPPHKNDTTEDCRTEPWRRCCIRSSDIFQIGFSCHALGPWRPPRWPCPSSLGTASVMWCSSVGFTYNTANDRSKQRPLRYPPCDTTHLGEQVSLAEVCCGYWPSSAGCGTNWVVTVPSARANTLPDHTPPPAGLYARPGPYCPT